jgi:hypothetical protein
MAEHAREKDLHSAHLGNNDPTDRSNVIPPIAVVPSWPAAIDASSADAGPADAGPHVANTTTGQRLKSVPAVASVRYEKT